jgi:mannose-1-phosphate guanylyltransferase
MLAIPSASIDYAVMEKSSKVKVVPSSFGWNDIGSFDSLDKEIDKDADGNSAGENFVNVGSTDNCIISDRVVTTVDVSNLIIVDTPDALLVASKGSSQKVKDVVDELNARSKHNKKLVTLTKSHTTDFRPWGQYTVLEEHERFKIKRIVVKPGKRLSLQKHYHRSEHWVVVSGSAVVTKGEQEFFIKANESIYIPIGETHRIENPGKIDLVLLEVQVGEYLSEEDIVRYNDDYGRES